MFYNIIDTIGNTPNIFIKGNPSYHAKLEGNNPFGSIKDRAAAYVIQKGYERGLISIDTEVIESSSGNFAIALAAVCQLYGNKFTCIVDPSLTPLNRLIIKAYGAKIIIADTADENGSFLKNRLDIVRMITNQNPKYYWINQYDNSDMRQSYCDTVGVELIRDYPVIDYLFIPVSTCGTISGLSSKIKSVYSETRIIAVDIEGSKIFNDHSREKRHIPGMGASIVPGNLSHALIDDVVYVQEKEAVDHCRLLLNKSILVGGSSGATSAAIEKYFAHQESNKTIVAIFPDRGDRYFTNIFSDDWCDKNIYMKEESAYALC